MTTGGLGPNFSGLFIDWEIDRESRWCRGKSVAVHRHPYQAVIVKSVLPDRRVALHRSFVSFGKTHLPESAIALCLIIFLFDIRKFVSAFMNYSFSFRKTSGLL